MRVEHNGVTWQRMQSACDAIGLSLPAAFADMLRLGLKETRLEHGN